MKGLIAALVLAFAIVGTATVASADPSEYGLKEVNAAASTTQAGAHPDFVTSFKLKTEGEAGTNLPSATESASISLPPGLLANPTAVPTCSAEQLVTTDLDDPSNETGCPQAAQVGITEVTVKKEGAILSLVEPVYNMVPRDGEPARLGFIAVSYPVLVDTGLRQGPGEDYGATVRIVGISSRAPLFSARTTIWGVPAAEAHDGERITAYEALNGGLPLTPSGKRPSGLSPVPFMLNPTRCGGSQGVSFVATPYLLPETHSEAFAPLSPNSGCGLLEFKPDISVNPTSSSAVSGSGLDVDLTFPSDGLRQPSLLGEDEQKRAELILPEGVTVNPSQAVGLTACSESEFNRESASSEPGEGCPGTSKIGSVNAISPLIDQPAQGAVYVAQPYANPFDSLLALYLVLKIPDRGVVVRLAGKVSADARTGQLVATFGEAPFEIPQLPVSSFHLHFREGARSPLVLPPHCGSYSSTATFTSWSGRTAVTHPSFTVSSGIGGGLCPGGAAPFAPSFGARALKLNAGAYSPFYMRLSRQDGDQDLTRFSATLPPGAVAKLAGVTECVQGAIEAAKLRAGTTELTSPSCPEASEIGHLVAGVGVGSVLTYATGKLYLAGPYHGAPLSIAAIVPAVAGPFDLGTVVIQEALRLNPNSSRAEVESSASEPLPHILAGIPLRVRDVRIYVDRPAFMLNPTNCDPLATNAQLWGGGADPFSAADDSLQILASRFQVANCANLGFKPKLAIRLKGGVKRGDHPALKAVLTPRKGDANIGSAQVTLPHSAFLEQAHIRTVCTRVQFAAGAGNGADCPAGSVYGVARAWTPLLDRPLRGRVYLRSNPKHLLPDLVAALHSQLDVNIVARIDSVNARIRSSFESVPDAPVSRFVLEMSGGRKGLIVNSSNLCSRKHRAKANFIGQNGKLFNAKPVLAVKCKKANKDKGRRRGREHRAS